VACEPSISIFSHHVAQEFTLDPGCLLRRLHCLLQRLVLVDQLSRAVFDQQLEVGVGVLQARVQTSVVDRERGLRAEELQQLDVR